MILERIKVGDVLVLKVKGKITLFDMSSEAFRDEIIDLLRNQHNNILIDAEQMSYIDSSGIGELVSAFTLVTNSGGQLKLLALCKRVKDLLQITKLYTVFEVFDDEAKAVRSFH